MNEPHNHHFVPRGFLRQWAADGTHIVRIFCRHGRTISQKASTKQVAYSRDLYNIKDPGDSLAVFLMITNYAMQHGVMLTDWNFEKSLMKEIDDSGLKAHRAVLEDAAAMANETIMTDLLRFLYVLNARNPKMLQHIQETAVDDLRALFKKYNIAPEPFVDCEDMGRDLNAAKLSVIGSILDRKAFMRSYDGVASVLIDTDPTVNCFVTSDVPYVRLELPPSISLHLAPLSPSRCLLMSRDHRFVSGVKTYANEFFY